MIFTPLKFVSVSRFNYIDLVTIGVTIELSKSDQYLWAGVIILIGSLVSQIFRRVFK